jgi:prepilin-type N-terminal cleavage/methylation domain-containing protein
METNKQKGFTIIELIVVMAVFLFIVGAALSIFISIIQRQKEVLAEQQILNQVSYVEEYMSKALRMAAVSSDSSCVPSGYIYLLTRYDTGLQRYSGVKFLNQTGLDTSGDPICQEFFLANDSSDPANPVYVLKELKNITDETSDADAVALTSTNLKLNNANPMRFTVNGLAGDCGGSSPCGAMQTDSVQPRVTILFNVKIAGDTQTASRIIQTTVSQRNLKVQ